MAIVTSGTDPNVAWQPPSLFERTWIQKEIIKNYARGFRTSDESVRETGCGLGNDACYQVRRNYELGIRDRSRPISTIRIDLSREPAPVREIFAEVHPVYIHWNGFASSSANAPLRRHVIATPGGIQREKDFDVNIDGLAHYGLLPDFIQDLKNTGLPDYALSALLQSAESYVSMWEKAVQRSGAMGRP